MEHRCTCTCTTGSTGVETYLRPHPSSSHRLTPPTYSPEREGGNATLSM